MTAAVATSRKSLVASALWQWGDFVASVVIAFLISPILISRLGDARYGIWSLIEGVLAFLLLLDMGVGASVVRFVARFQELKDSAELNRLYSVTLAFFSAGGLAVLLVVALLAGLTQRPLGVPSEHAAEARVLLLLLGINTAVGLPAGVLGSILMGLGRFGVKNAIQATLRIITAIAFLAVLRVDGGLQGLGFVVLAGTILKAIAERIAVARYIPSLRFHLSDLSLATFREIRGYSFQAFLAMIAGRLSFSLDAIVISSFLLPQYVAYFAVAARLTEYVKGAIRAATGVLTPAISALEARGDLSRIRQIFVDGFRVVLWLVLPLEFGLLVLGKPFLRLWLGEQYADASYPVLAILSAPLFLSLANSVSGRILYGMGRLQWFTKAVCVEAIANVVLSLALVQWFGIQGVAWGTTIPHFAFNIVLVFYMCRTLAIPIQVLAIDGIRTPLVGSLIAPLLWLVLAHYVGVDSWPSFLVTGLIGVSAHACIAMTSERLLLTAKHDVAQSSATPDSPLIERKATAQ